MSFATPTVHIFWVSTRYVFSCTQAWMALGVGVSVMALLNEAAVMAISGAVVEDVDAEGAEVTRIRNRPKPCTAVLKLATLVVEGVGVAAVKPMDPSLTSHTVSLGRCARSTAI